MEELTTAFLTASRVLVAVSAESLEEVGDNLTIPQFRTLVVLGSHGEMNLNSLAQILQVNASSALRMIDRLLVSGLVTRQENPENRREVLLDLTPAGTSIVKAVTGRRRREISRIVAKMTDRDRRGLLAALQSFARAAGEPSAADDELSVGQRPEVSALGW